MKQFVTTMVMFLVMCVFGVEVSVAEKITAAEDGNAEAQFQLGECYAKGEGIATNAVKAVEWYYKAAEQGHPNAQYALSMHYASGNGVTKDMRQAYKWCRKAARRGHRLAQLKLPELTPNEDEDEGNTDKHIPTIESEAIFGMAFISIFSVIASFETSRKISVFVSIISAVGIFIGLFFVKGLSGYEIIMDYVAASFGVLLCLVFNPSFIRKMAVDNMAYLGPWLSLAGMIYTFTMCFRS